MTAFINNLSKNWVFLFLFVYAIILYHTAWLSDDSYITLRSVDNFVNGFGPVWNPSERVQVFTHPLWYLILSAVYYFTREAFFTTLAISIFISITTFFLFSFLHNRSASLVISLSILLLSNAYMDYSTSGLENALTHLLVFCFLFFYLQEEPNIKILGILAGLTTLNRIDLLLLLLPALGWLFLQSPSRKNLFHLLAGFTPFIIWEIFSLFYYGFPFPNTAYAKLNVLIPRLQLIQQGVWYFTNSLKNDPITLIVTFAGIFIAFKSHSFRTISLALGSILYLIYVLWFGGDFMSGRFFSPTLLISVLLINYHLENIHLTRMHLSSIFVVIFLLEGWSLTANPSSFMVQNKNPSELIDTHGIADEQAIYVSEAGLFGAQVHEIQPRSVLVTRGLNYQQQGKQVIMELNIGYLGFFAGPDIHIIDQYGLADPMLARIPFNGAEWRPGHFFKALPKGYLNSIIQEKNLIANPSLAEYYNLLRLVTRGELFNRNRLIAIWKFNTGQYDYLMKEYIK